MKLAWHVAFGWAIAAMGAGLWFGYHAWRAGSQPMAMLSAILLLSAPMLGAAVRFARGIEPASDEGPFGALVTAIHCVDRSLRVVSLCRAHIGVACAWLFVLWFCQLTGYMSFRDFVIFYSIACAAAAGAFLPWLSSCERRFYDDRAEFRRRLGELEAAG